MTHSAFLRLSALLATGTSALTLTNVSLAQEAQEEIGQITVTGSRIMSDGYQAPTPVTVATAEALQLAAPISIQDGLNQLPQFTGSTTSTTGIHANIGNNGNLLNLRSLGAIRTLVLLDGNRVTPTDYFGTVDVNLLPQLLVQRVDVVTAGASAAYGSDAVAGVVNYVLDKEFTGTKGTVQGGMTSRGDYDNYRVGIAHGMDVGRAHILLSGEFYHNDGILKSERPYYNKNGTGVGANIGPAIPGTAANPYRYAENVFSNVGADGGLVRTGPFADTVFLEPGVYRQAVRGTPTGSPGFYIGPSDYFAQPDTATLAAAYRNGSAFARVDYDLTDTTRFHLQGIYAEGKTLTQGYASALIGRTYFSGNPFLPAPLQAQLTATNTPSFAMSKFMTEFGPSAAQEDIENIKIMPGFDGELGRFKWNLGYQYGKSTTHADQDNLVEFAKFAAAADAVRDPAGNIVCRPTLDPNPTVRARYADCVPINMFGNGAASAEARNYVTGTSMLVAKNVQEEAYADISGDLFNLWAGPLSAAVGINYRKQQLDLDSNADPAIPIDITGLRGIASATSRFFLTNTPTVHGKLNVKEAFGELALPLLKDKPVVQSLEINGAMRFTDYSTSGSVETWKYGGVWQPIDDLSLRVTRSRDIRAPTLYELFTQRTLGPTPLFDPHTGISSSTQLFGGGNPDLDPEVADTISVGLVAQPSFLPGLDASIDYYEIELKGAIATPQLATILNDCEASNGTAPTCSLITRPLPFSDRSPANYLTSIASIPANITSVKEKGIDFDVRYQADIAGGNLVSRLFLTHVSSLETQLTASAPVLDFAGWSEPGAGGVSSSVPKWKGLLSFTYSRDRFAAYIAERYIGKMELGPTIIYADPEIDPVFYTDLTLTYSLTPAVGNIDLFLTVNNLFDEAPPKVPNLSAGGTPGIAIQTLPDLYDLIGMNFTAGVRVSF